MSEGRLTNCWLWKPNPGNLWRASCFSPREIVDAATKEEAKAGLEQNLGPAARGLLRWFEEPEPVSRRAGASSTSDTPLPAIEGDAIAAAFHKKLVRRFHSDLVGDRTFTADEVLAIVNDAWNTRATA